MMRPHSELTCGSQVEKHCRSASVWVCIATVSSPGIRSASEAHLNSQLPSVLVPTSPGLCPIGEIQYWIMTRLMRLGLLILVQKQTILRRICLRHAKQKSVIVWKTTSEVRKIKALKWMPNSTQIRNTFFLLASYKLPAVCEVCEVSNICPLEGSSDNQFWISQHFLAV